MHMHWRMWGQNLNHASVRCIKWSLHSVSFFNSPVQMFGVEYGYWVVLKLFSTMINFLEWHPHHDPQEMMLLSWEWCHSWKGYHLGCCVCLNVKNPLNFPTFIFNSFFCFVAPAIFGQWNIIWDLAPSVNFYVVDLLPGNYFSPSLKTPDDQLMATLLFIEPVIRLEIALSFIQQSESYFKSYKYQKEAM